MTLPFHPLADLFPLIEGDEFAELVNSIRQNGQHDAIILFDGMVLDGRNRYRACLAAGVEPRTAQFTGNDPVAFVMDHNIHRRHLNESQRAMIGARLSEYSKSGTRTDLGEISPRSRTSQEAADLVNVNRATVVAAKKVLRDGTAEEIKAVEAGKAAVSTIAKEIRAKKPPEERAARLNAPLSATGKNPERIERQRVHAQMWGALRDALSNLTGLPLPSDVVSIARAHDRTGLVDAKLLSALEWLEGFSDAWTNKTASEDRNGYGHAGAGGGVIGAQQAQPPSE
jgi:ParB-like chromosome segregation protein Spo0J